MNAPVARQVIIDVFIFCVVLTPLLVLLVWGSPPKGGFWCRDQSLMYPYKPDTVPTSLLLMISLGGPFLVMSVTEAIRAASSSTKSRQQPGKWRGELMSLFKAYGTFLFGSLANCILTDTLKFSVGRPRPHFMDVCRPDFGQINCTLDGFMEDRFIPEYECTNTDVDQRLLRDAHLSFPSGHASMSVYSALFVMLYLQLRMHVTFSHLLRPAIQLLFVSLACLCCVTRVADHKHFASDVIAGVIVGLSVAWCTFYKLAAPLIPSSTSPAPSRAGLDRAISVESEPQTPTPLLRPERLVLSRGGHGGKHVFNNV